MFYSDQSSSPSSSSSSSHHLQSVCVIVMWYQCSKWPINAISDLPLACITLLRLASALARAPANPSRSASWFAGVSLSSTYILWKKVLSLFHASSLHTTKWKFISPDIHLWPLIVVTFPRTRIAVHGWHWMTLDDTGCTTHCSQLNPNPYAGQKITVCFGNIWRCREPFYGRCRNHKVGVL